MSWILEPRLFSAAALIGGIYFARTIPSIFAAAPSALMVLVYFMFGLYTWIDLPPATLTPPYAPVTLCFTFLLQTIIYIVIGSTFVSYCLQTSPTRKVKGPLTRFLADPVYGIFTLVFVTVVYLVAAWLSIVSTSYPISVIWFIGIIGILLYLVQHFIDRWFLQSSLKYQEDHKYVTSKYDAWHGDTIDELFWRNLAIGGLLFLYTASQFLERIEALGDVYERKVYTNYLAIPILVVYSSLISILYRWNLFKLFPGIHLNVKETLAANITVPSTNPMYSGLPTEDPMFQYAPYNGSQSFFVPQQMHYGAYMQGPPPQVVVYPPPTQQQSFSPPPQQETKDKKKKKTK